MKKRIQKYLAVIGMLAMLSPQALAAELYTVTTDFVNNKITVSGKGISDEKVIFQILKKGKSFDCWQKGGDPNEFILWQGQQTVNDEISFTVPYTDTLPAGTYMVRMISDMRENMGTETVELVGTKTYSDALTAMKQAAVDKNYQVFQACIDGRDKDVSPVGFNLSLYNKLSSSVTAESLLASYMKNVENDANFAEVKFFDENAQKQRGESFRTFMLIEALKKGNIITDFKTELSETEIPSNDSVLWKNINDCIKTNAEWSYFLSKAEKASGAVSNIDTLKQVLINSLILTETCYADGNDIQNALITLGYGGKIGIASPVTNSKVYAAMSGKDYTDIDSFVSAYKGYVSQYSNSSTGGSSSSGGGSKNTSGSNNTYYPGKFERTDQTSETKNQITVEFVDIEGISWAQEAIIALADKGILSGKDNGYFDPNGSVTREEFAKILVCAAGYENESYSENHFADVNENAWYCKFVNIAYEKGLLYGIGEGNFGIGMQISRQDMSVMICNALAKKGVNLQQAEMNFADRTDISEYAYSSVSALVAMGAVNGVSDTEFQPLGNATRAQAAKIIYGVLDKLQ